MTDLCIIIPTRGRPDAASAVIDACHATCATEPNLVLSVDADDPDLDRYTRLAAGRAAVFVDEDPGGHVRAINRAAAMALRHSDPYAIVKLDDDHRPRTVGWDSEYLAALRRTGTGIVYGNDLLQGFNMPTSPGITADIVKALGFVAPPTLGHLYCDDFWRDLGRGAGCLTYLPEVIVEHLHPGAGKAIWDAGYARVNSPLRYTTDRAAYDEYRRTRMSQDVRTVADLMAAAR